MSRTKRTRTKSYYGFTPMREDEANRNVAFGSEFHRARYYHGYDGGWKGRVSRAYRVGYEYALGYADYGCGRACKRFEKRRAAKLFRKATKHIITTTLRNHGYDK